MIVGHNIRTEEGGRLVEIGGQKLLVGPSLKIANHSPNGFNWGYGGSGPAQLALALLLHFTSPRFAQLHYQQFKWDVIAKFDGAEPFEIAESDVVAWAKKKGWE